MVIVDTSIIIDYLRREDKSETTFEKLIQKEGRANLAISILSVQELYSGKSVQGLQDQEFLTVFLVSVKIFPYNLDVAKKAGEIFRSLRKQVGFVDPTIAATAIVNGAELATLNAKDFEEIKNLERYPILSLL